MNGKKAVKALFAVIMAGAVLGWMLPARAEDVSLENILVTPYRFEEYIHSIPRAVTVIGEAELKYLNVPTIPDLLRYQTGITVRDYYANGTKVSVDIRGFGETGSNNTLVLINGRRVNEIDLSGVDWTQIPLDQVERIEIVRGSGSVLYGDNACGGTINIITKKGRGKPSLQIETQAGSYEMNGQNAWLQGSRGGLSYSATSSRRSTNGYRDNSYYDGTDYGVNLVYEINPDFSINASGSYHDADYGLPGALSENHLKTMSRQSTRFPDDDIGETDYNFKVGGQKEVLSLGYFEADVSFRRRTATSKFLSSSAGFNPVFESRIDTIGISPKFIFDRQILNRKHNLIVGADIYLSDYMSDNYNEAGSLQNFTDIDKDTAGVYLQDEFEPIKNLSITAGCRTEKAEYSFDYHDNAGSLADVNTDLDSRQDAYSAGLAYKYMTDSSIFINAAHAFRFPVTDEYFSVWGTPPVNTGLNPQTGKQYEAGIRQSIGSWAIADITAFKMDLKNELYYDPNTFANANYDKTSHQGIEAGVHGKFLNIIDMKANYTYTQAEFIDGPYDTNDIPAVPRHKASFISRFNLPRGIRLALTGNYVGKRYFISDQANSLGKMNSYFTADANITYEYRNLTFSAGLNNIFNEEYSEYGVKSGSLRYYYPSPGRNFNVRMGCKF